MLTDKQRLDKCRFALKAERLIIKAQAEQIKEMQLLIDQASEKLKVHFTEVIQSLPDFMDIVAKVEKKEELTPLEQFIYENEPAGDSDEVEFRCGLENLIKYIRKC